ncbi:ABC transporter ATP-binding protein [Planctomycetota bacterium]
MAAQAAQGLVLDRTPRELLSLVWGFTVHLRREWGLALRAALLMALITGIALVGPWIHRAVIDEALMKRDAPFLWQLLAILLVLALAQFGLSFLRTMVLLRLRLKILFLVRRDVMEHLQFLPLGFHRATNPGYLMVRLGSDVERLAPLFGDSLLGVLQNTLLIIFGIPLVFYINYGLALMVLGLVPFYLLNHYLFARRTRRLAAENQELWARVWGRVEENLSIITSVKLFGRELYETIRFMRVAKQAVRHQVRLTVVQALGALMTQMFTGLGPIVVLAYAGTQIIAGHMTLGDLVAFSVYMGLLVGPVRSVFQYGLGVQGALASLERVYDILDREREIGPEDRDLDPLEGFEGRIELRGVSFSYRPAQPVLRGVDLTLAPGQAVALQGANGSGKTTIVNLIVGLHAPSEGVILLDGRPMTAVSKRALRRKIGVVSRDNFFFCGSIRENIAYGRAGATDEEIERAARLARVTDFCEEFPLGLDSHLGERGDELSRGQLQRVALARTLLRDPAVLILDEGTTSIDRSSRELIHKTLEGFSGQKTLIVISHEDDWPALDQAYVLEDGQLQARPSDAGQDGPGD